MKKSVFITGGSSGIGAATAIEAGALGWRVFVGYHKNFPRAQGVIQKIQQTGGEAYAIPLSLDSPEPIEEALTQVAQHSNTLEALVLCASPAPRLASFLKTDREQLSEQLLPNVMGNRDLVAGAWKRFFRAQGGAHIVAVLSMAAHPPVWAHMVAYVVAKRALAALLECALAEFSKDGLRVTLLYPDYTETPMLTALEPRVLEAARAKRPHGFLQPQEVAKEIMTHLIKTSPSSALPGSATLEKR